MLPAPTSDSATLDTPIPAAEPDAVMLTRELTPRSIDVWQSMLGLSLQPDVDPAVAISGHRRWSGCIALSGEWRGAVTVSCIDPLARVMTGAMFGIEPADATDAEIQDAIGEMANMLGGQTKLVLGDRCVLGLPVVIEGDNFEATVPHSHAMMKLRFSCEGYPVEISVVGANARVTSRRDVVRPTDH